MDLSDFPNRLRQSLQRPLPGTAAQYGMAHAVRRDVPPPPSNARQAGVLALFYPLNDEWHIVLIQRSHHPRDRHGGQISFPGGRREEADRDLAATALREANEEVGVPTEAVHLLGALTPLYIPVSNFLVNPFVGYTSTRPAFVPQASEVDRVLEIPFAAFQMAGVKKVMDMPIGARMVLQQVPYFSVAGQVVWGATAMMLNELLAVVAL